MGEINRLFSRFMPSGFYYKTFMWPSWKVYEGAIRRAAGLGQAPEQPDPDHYDKTNAHCDVLVVGTGPSGLAAALAAGRSGARVLLVEQDSELGGSLLSSEREAEIAGQPAMDWVKAARAELESLPDVRILTRTQCFAYYDHNFLGLLERVTDHLPQAERPAHLPRQRFWKVRAGHVVMATGAIERPLVFRDNDRPGIMLASAASAYVNRYAVKPGKRAVLFTNNDSGYAAALDLKQAGLEVVAVLDARAEPSGPLTERARETGIPIKAGRVVTGTKGRFRITALTHMALDKDGKSVSGQAEEIACDLLLSSGGWTPSVHLFCQSKGTLHWDHELSCFRPHESMQKAQGVAGSANGSFGLGRCLAEGHAAGQAAAESTGHNTSTVGEVANSEDRGFLPIRELFLVPSDKPVGAGGKHFVDLQNDVTAADLLLALREGYSSIEHVKRYTTTGMGTDQGKTSNVNAIGIVAEQFNATVPEVGVTTFRPPYTAVTFGVFAGRDVDELLDPARITPMHSWHVNNGALFEHVGQWLRAWYYPREGEDLRTAVSREVKATRDSSASWMPPRWARSTSRDRTPRSSSTSSIPTPGANCRSGAVATA
ncbi:FAD-dependent oxidoreductase [Fodinicurvata halophila]|uniref:FAD-dependent oxidoreductase n=1 Tax=Fodinicurvata halophila TaxID=1419723 RepID=UPI00363F3FEF